MNKLANELIKAFVEDAENNAMQIGTKIIVPTVYRCYLDEPEYKDVDRIYQQIREETIKALDKMLNRKNQIITFRQFILRLLIPKWIAIFSERAEELRNLPRLEKPMQGWQIVNPVTAPDVVSPMIRTAVEMTFSQPQEGGNTVRYTTLRQGGKIKSSVSDTYNSRSLSQHSDTKSGGIEYGVIEYQNANGNQVYSIKSDTVKIGRGSINSEVDLELTTDVRVSRLHCILRRDTKTQLFTIEDCSKEGTAVDGHRIQSKELVSVPSSCEIDLAGVCKLRFKSNI